MGACVGSGVGTGVGTGVGACVGTSVGTGVEFSGFAVGGEEAAAEHGLECFRHHRSKKR